MQSDRNSLIDYVVFDSVNMELRDDDRISYTICKKQIKYKGESSLGAV